MRRAKEHYAGDGRLKPAALAASVPGPVNAGVWQRGHADSGVVGGLSESFRPFVLEGFLTQAGRDAKVPVTTLRDTGADKSHVLESILPFSYETGDDILMLRMLRMGLSFRLRTAR